MMMLAMERDASDEDVFWVMGESWKETFTAFLDTSASVRAEKERKREIMRESNNSTVTCLTRCLIVEATVPHQEVK